MPAARPSTCLPARPQNYHIFFLQNYSITGSSADSLFKLIVHNLAKAGNLAAPTNLLKYFRPDIQTHACIYSHSIHMHTHLARVCVRTHTRIRTFTHTHVTPDA